MNQISRNDGNIGIRSKQETILADLTRFHRDATALLETTREVMEAAWDSCEDVACVDLNCDSLTRALHLQGELAGNLSDLARWLTLQKAAITRRPNRDQAGPIEFPASWDFAAERDEAVVVSQQDLLPIIDRAEHLFRRAAALQAALLNDRLY